MPRLHPGLLAIAFIVAALCSTAAHAANYSQRAGDWDWSVSLRYLEPTHIDFDGGSSMNIHDDLSWGFNFGYHSSPYLEWEASFDWDYNGYDAHIVSADTPPQAALNVQGEIWSYRFGGAVTWNILPTKLTPFVTAGVGWTHAESSVPGGPPATGCWWDPFYGYVCDDYRNTRLDEGATYRTAVGLRWEFSRHAFMRLSLIEDSFNLENSYGSPFVTSWRVEVGTY